MSWRLLATLPLADPPLTPDGDEARSLLRRELLHPDYHQDNLILRLIDWLSRLLDRGLAAARETPPLTTFAAMLVGLLLVVALGWLASRARRSRRAPVERRAVLADEQVTAAQLRARAEQALAEGRPSDALVDAFPAVALRQVERDRIDDVPGATAHEVAVVLAEVFPGQATDVHRSHRSRPRPVRRPGRDPRPGGRRTRPRRAAGGERVSIFDATAPLSSWRRPACSRSSSSCWWATARQRPSRSTPTTREAGRPGGGPVLDDQGVDVTVVRGADALDRATLDSSTTVVVASTYLLGNSTTRRLLGGLAGADFVVAGPSPSPRRARPRHPELDGRPRRRPCRPLLRPAAHRAGGPRRARHRVRHW